MTIAKLLVDADLLILTGSSRSPFGPIWLSVDGEAFPEAHWTDFVIAVAQAFVVAATDLIEERTQDSRVYFMDGPFEIGIRAQTARRWILTLRGGGSPNEVTKGTPVDGHYLARSIDVAARSLLHQCRINDWRSSDIDELATTTMRLRTLID